MRKATTETGEDYWEYVLLYVDDCLVISHRPEEVLRNKIEGDVIAWSFSLSQYVKAAVHNVERYLREKEGTTVKFPKPRNAPMSNDYCPELNETAELDLVDAAYYQSLIGVLRWIVELGRVDINVEVSMLSSCLALPRFGHLQQLYNIFAYLKQQHNTEMIFDPLEPVINKDEFPKEDWSHSVYTTGEEGDLDKP